jgi:hypothetical protein
MVRKQLHMDRFLGEMERVVPWGALIGALTSYYLRRGKAGVHRII